MPEGTVFIGNIPYDATETSLRDVFGEVGPVRELRLVADRDTGKLKGYGFVEFDDYATAMSAVRNVNGREYNGRQLRVDHAETMKGEGGGGGAGGASASAGLSWDDERKMWERKGKGGRRGSGGGSPWDLRSPSSLRALRSQAERVFDGAVGNALFTSPSIRRLRQSTDELWTGVRSLFRFSWFS